MLYGKDCIYQVSLSVVCSPGQLVNAFIWKEKDLQQRNGWNMTGPRHRGYISILQVAQSIISINVLANISATRLLGANVPVNKDLCHGDFIIYPYQASLVTQLSVGRDREKHLM